ncbi:L,D-transpeptidase [Undibacterium sp. CY18W]|uniref:L,D-transpeptidase n=2 Tax=Undibacterium hunanense TaxID=2762292 RepID=A0ABR6ZKY0_9BURK|nr:L,D-transpeptidase [Undibacterium hunanense]
MPTQLAGQCFASAFLQYPLFIFAALVFAVPAQALESAMKLKEIYETTVEQQLVLPSEELQAYMDQMSVALTKAGTIADNINLPSQFILLVDRNPKVQAAMLFWTDEEGQYQFIGASPVSTGRAIGFEHFQTPTGVFAHTLANLDYRAEGSKNSKGIRGYGAKGRRVFDFGWQKAKKGWGDRQIADMRLQMHATDPDSLEKRLGSVQSKGCVRIPASLNVLFDRYGLLDADYDAALATGRKFWVLDKNRQDNAWAGRYMVVIDSERQEKPEWAGISIRKQVKVQ